MSSSSVSCHHSSPILPDHCFQFYPLGFGISLKDNMSSGGARRAPFIVIEGLDRSGKTTQTSQLYARLKEAGTEASLIKFPGMPQLIIPEGPPGRAD